MQSVIYLHNDTAMIYHFIHSPEFLILTSSKTKILFLRIEKMIVILAKDA